MRPLLSVHHRFGRLNRVSRSAPSVQVMECWFHSIGTDLPAPNRWYTFVPHVVRQRGALFCHRFLLRVLERAYGARGSGQAIEAVGDSYHAEASTKQAISIICLANLPDSVEFWASRRLPLRLSMS